MPDAREKRTIGLWNGDEIHPGEARDVRLAVGESYSSRTVSIPIHVRRSTEPGPVVFVSAALHGDEINGTGAIRHLIQQELDLQCGSVVFVPVLNMLAFERHSRYLPDRRDLNRCFPGTASGSLASRFARKIFDELVLRCDYGIDLHTAAIRRTNYPNIRGDLTNPEVKRIAEAFGCEIIINGKGPAGSFRREATSAGCPTIVMEGGEIWKVEPGVVESATRGVRNVLQELGLLAGASEKPPYQVTVQGSKWIRAERGGFLQFHVQPGDIVEMGQPLATNTTLLGRERSYSKAPFDAVVIGMTTLPSVSPGEPVCNLGKLPRGTKPHRLRRQRSDEDGLEKQLSNELATNVLVVDHKDSTSSEE